jgi:hypothetical protein
VYIALSGGLLFIYLFIVLLFSGWSKTETLRILATNGPFCQPRMPEEQKVAFYGIITGRWLGENLPQYHLPRISNKLA